jgi:hypothetical protein
VQASGGSKRAKILITGTVTSGDACRCMEHLLITLLRKERYPVLTRYGATLIIVGITVSLRIALNDELQHYPVLLFISGVFHGRSIHSDQRPQ